MQEVGGLLSSSAFWGGVLAVAIATVMSSIELISKYPTRSIAEIFGTKAYFAFIVLNAAFCAVFYAAIPYLTGLTVSSELSKTFTDSALARSIIAGFGYLILARTSVLDLKIKGETLGVGGDMIYNVLAQYILRRHSLSITRSIRAACRTVYTAGTGDGAAFLHAVESLANQKTDAEERRRLADNIALIVKDAKVLGEYDVCLALYTLIRDNTVSADEARDLIVDARADLKKDEARKTELERRLKDGN